MKTSRFIELMLSILLLVVPMSEVDAQDLASKLSSQEALLELTAMHYSTRLTFLQAVKDSFFRDQVTRLFSLAKHSDKCVRQSAIDLLSFTIADEVNISSPPEFVRRLLEREQTMSQRPRINPVADTLVDILYIRNNYPRQPDVTLFFQDEASSNSLRRLIQYTGDPDRRVRAQAVATLTSLQPERPGGINEPELWENWMRTRTAEYQSKPTHQPSVAPVAYEDAILFLLSIPHKSSLTGLTGAGLMQSAETRDKLIKLVGLLKNEDSKVRKAAYDVLLAIQPERCGTSYDIAAWDSWIDALKVAYPDVGPFPPPAELETVEDSLCEVLSFRAHVQPGTSETLFSSAAVRIGLSKLITLLGHTNYIVRLAASKTLSTTVMNTATTRRPTTGGKLAWEEWYQEQRTKHH